jgi:conjugative transfer region protein TrbK
MHGRAVNISAIGRIAGYVVVAVGIAATAFHFRHDSISESAPVRTLSIESDPFASELAHCQAIGMGATHDAACEAAWAENRRRFFTYCPADNATAARRGEQNSSGKPEDQ